jgi:serine/threonine protein kinase
MIGAFQNERKLFFVLQYCPGGELFNVLQNCRRMKEDQARFYVVQLILALEYLHTQDIIYREYSHSATCHMNSLKPENILIDRDGYVKLADFGLSKMGMKGSSATYSICGTPEYLAPEILFRAGHGKAVDWWTLGVLLYEMLLGVPPFYSQRRDEIFESIKFASLKFPKNDLSKEAISFVEGLLNKNPECRLGCSTKGVQELKSHAWLASVEWERYLRKEVRPPFVPSLSGELDIAYFNPVDRFPAVELIL